MEFLSSKINRLISNMTKSTDATTLHCAVRNQNKNDILKVLSNVRKENLKVPDPCGDTVLHLVLANENLTEKEILELLEALLHRGTDINAEDKRGKTILHRAIQRRMKGVVDLLVKRKVDINKCDDEGNSITHDFIEDESKWFHETLERRKRRFQMTDSEVVKCEFQSEREAQENESARFAEFLIEKGFNFDLRNNSGKSALLLAFECNLLHILHVLVKHTSDIHFIDHRKKSLLQLFIETKAACRDLRESRYKDWYPEYASRYSAKIVRILLYRGVSTWPHDSDGKCTLLRTAIECQEDKDIVKLIVDHSWKSMEKYSATQIFAELFEIFLWWGESKSEHFWPGLCALLARGADVNAKDKSGVTPLYRAFHRKNICAVYFLIDRRADFRATTNFGENLFHAVARLEFPNEPTDNPIELEALFHFVARKGCCDVNARNSTNETPLHLAARCENLVIACKLIERGAEVNLKDGDGRTPLHHALYHGKSEKLVESLLKNGANPNCKDQWGRRPLSIALDVSGRLVLLLLKRGAYVNAYDQADLPFWKMISNGNSHTAKKMLAYGADINNNDAVVRSIFESPCDSASSGQDDKSLKSRKLLLQHWIKLNAAKMPCSKEYETHANTDECQEVYKNCLQEIEKLKVTCIDGCTSIYSFLRMNFGCRRKHMNNEKLRRFVQSPELEQQFPNYSVVILASYRETVLWKSLLEPAKLAWLKITDIRLPSECLEPIFAHLRNQDMVSMIEFDEGV